MGDVRYLGMVSLDSIFRLLEEATARLNEAAIQIRDLPLEPRSDHLHRVGKALSQIFEIQYHVFALNPDLTPDLFAAPSEQPEGALAAAMRHARVAEEKGHPDVAAAILKWVATYVRGTEQEQRARVEIARLERKGDT
jgi:hypothetical protein